jgi:hypothetical protein
MSVEEYFSTGPPHERPVFDAVMAHLSTVGDVHVEPVSVGIFLKRSGRFAELRPMEKWVALSLSLPSRVDHPLIVRKVLPYRGRYFHTFNVRAADDIDDDICGWLTQAYLSSPD